MTLYGVENVPDAPFQIINGVGQIPDADEVMGNDESIREWLRANALTALIPTGTLLSYGGTTAPEGFLFCDGEPYDTTVEVDLFEVIAYAFGGSGGNFNVPDMRGRVPVGKGTNSTVDALGENEGLGEASRSSSHTHYYDHTHVAQGVVHQPQGQTTVAAPGGQPVPTIQHVHNYSDRTSGTDTPNTGLGTPAFMVINSIIKG